MFGVNASNEPCGRSVASKSGVKEANGLFLWMEGKKINVAL